MKFFKKRRVEEIHLEIKESLEKDNHQTDQMYSEKSDILSKHAYFDVLTREEKINKIQTTYSGFKTMNQMLLSQYYINKIFVQVAMNKDGFETNTEAIDQRMARIENEKDTLDKKMGALTPDFEEDDLSVLYEEVIQLTSFQNGVVALVETIRKAHYSHLKIATVNVCMHKTTEELATLYKNMALFLHDYKDLTEAAEFIFFNSGQLIVKTTRALMECLEAIPNKDHLSKYPLSYFIKSDDIITLTLTEWIDLYQKIKFVTKLLNGSDLIQTLHYKNQVVQFEMRYLVLMMYMEKESKSKKITQFHM